MGIEFNNLKMYRKQNKFTQEQVAERLGVSRQAVAKWERGESLPDIENCIAMADMYEVSVDSLVRNLQNLPTSDDGEGKKHIFGVSRVTDKGQITLPKKCREVFDIQTGDSILFLGDTDKGIALIKLGKII
ncbi:MAG: helix-turn-helix domain-containing protein [Oscillospiraceae bacterium]